MKIKIEIRIVETHTIIREVDDAEFEEAKADGGDVCAWLDEQFQDDELQDSEISTDAFDVQAWEVVK